MKLSKDRDTIVKNAIFVSSDAPWFIRGGYPVSTMGAGVFSSIGTSGYAASDDTFRVVLLDYDREVL